MRQILQWPLSLLFVIQMYVAMVVIGLLYLPAALRSPQGAVDGCHAYCRWVRLTARVLCNLRTEVRGSPPTDPVLIAAKHQSFLDIILIYGAVPQGRFIMKKELTWTPIFGWFAKRVGSVPVDRGKRGAAIAKMKEDVARGAERPGQLIIYSQGTRVAPGVKMPYKVGTALLYEQLGQPCVPVATNVGVFWPRHGIYRKPGLAVVEFLDPIPPGKPVAPFMAELEQVIESTSDRLMAEAGFPSPSP